MIPQKPLTLLCVQPAMLYYAWQVEVMLENFKSLSLHRYFDIHLLFAYNKSESNWNEHINWVKLIESKYNDVASFFYYQDTRKSPIRYISSIRPNILKQHFKRFPLLGKSNVFYHDSDIIFTKFPDFLYELLADDNTWYVSDTKSYIGYNYIKSKGQDVLDQMCSIVGINEQLVKEKEEESGGAQYLMKGVDWVMFEKMEMDCEIMFHKITELNKKKLSEDPLHHPLQIWTADMWCLLWSAWLRGYETRIIKELDFCWATENVESYTQKYIFHNAGVTNLEKQTLFYKADYRTTHPFNVDGSSFDQTKASYKYFQFLKEVGKNSPIVYA